MLAARQHFYLLCIASSLIFFSTCALGLAYGMDHWRISKSSLAINDTVVSQGFLHECKEAPFNSTHKLECVPIRKGREIWRMQDKLDFVKIFLLTSILCGAGAIGISLSATLSEKPRFCIPVTSFEAMSGLFTTVALIVYGSYFFESDWSIGWCFYVACVIPILSSISCGIHIYVGDVSFFGKKFCKRKQHLNKDIEL